MVYETRQAKDRSRESFQNCVVAGQDCKQPVQTPMRPISPFAVPSLIDGLCGHSQRKQAPSGPIRAPRCVQIACGSAGSPPMCPAEGSASARPLVTHPRPTSGVPTPDRQSAPWGFAFSDSQEPSGVVVSRWASGPGLRPPAFPSAAPVPARARCRPRTARPFRPGSADRRRPVHQHWGR